MVASNPEKLAEWFNEKYLGAYRQVVAEEVKDMTDCWVTILPRRLQRIYRW